MGNSLFETSTVLRNNFPHDERKNMREKEIY